MYLIGQVKCYVELILRLFVCVHYDNISSFFSVHINCCMLLYLILDYCFAFVVSIFN